MIAVDKAMEAVRRTFIGISPVGMPPAGGIACFEAMPALVGTGC